MRNKTRRDEFKKSRGLILSASEILKINEPEIPLLTKPAL